MDCPCCKEPMIVLELDQVEIDYCIKCKGIWLDAGELELLLESSAKKDEVLSSFIPADNAKEKPRKCPICLKNMKKVLAGRSEQILIDKCGAGHGIWFDKGELYNIIKMGTIDEENKVLDILKDMFENELSRKQEE